MKPRTKEEIVSDLNSLLYTAIVNDDYCKEIYHKSSKYPTEDGTIEEVLQYIADAYQNGDWYSLQISTDNLKSDPHVRIGYLGINIPKPKGRLTTKSTLTNKILKERGMKGMFMSGADATFEEMSLCVRELHELGFRLSIDLSENPSSWIRINKCMINIT